MKSSLTDSLIKIEPSDTLLFKPSLSAKSSSSITIKNLSENTVCFKVKTSAPKEFLVTPINGLIHSSEEEKLSISFVGAADKKNKGQKFLIEVCIASDISSADWKTGSIQFKLGTHFLVSDEEEKKEIEDRSARRSSVSVYSEAVDEESEKVVDDEKKMLTSRNSELSSSIDQLKAQIDKISHKLKFSKDIDVVSAEIGGKYAIPHLALMFILGLVVGYYILG